jgi:hypothetical protein
MPAIVLHMIPITWPFAVWGLDMVGLLKIAPSGFTHLLVAVDKFTKWVEAKPIRKLDGKMPLNLSRTFWLDLASHIASSLTMALTCLREKLKNTTITTESAST